MEQLFVLNSYLNWIVILLFGEPLDFDIYQQIYFTHEFLVVDRDEKRM